MLGKEVMITKSLANTALAKYSIEATVSISLQNIRLSFIETSSKIDCKKRGRLTTSATFAANIYIKSFWGARRFGDRLSKSLESDLSGNSEGKQQFSYKVAGYERRKIQCGKMLLPTDNSSIKISDLKSLLTVEFNKIKQSQWEPNHRWKPPIQVAVLSLFLFFGEGQECQIHKQDLLPVV